MLPASWTPPLSGARCPAKRHAARLGRRNRARSPTPDRIFWVDGSEEEKELLLAEAVAQGVLIKLNQEKLPGCYYHRSNPNDVARVEQCTFICTPAKDEAGPTNNWARAARDVRRSSTRCSQAR